MDGMIKIINSQEESNINVYHEKLLKSDKLFSKSYNIEIISKRKVLVEATFNLDLQNHELVITTSDFLTISVKFADILSLICPEEKDTSEIFDQLLRNSKDQKTEETLQGKKIGSLNFFPLFTVSKCDCCGWIICKCKETIKERRAKVK
jgi:hypothetical protein